MDFRKAYDSICLKHLLYRLEEIGLIAKKLDIIKLMYKSPKVSLIHQDKISQTFLTPIGLKQSDMPRRLLKNSRFPDTVSDIPYLDDTKINNLLFADDLAIFSLLKEDLQKRIQYYNNIITNGD